MALFAVLYSHNVVLSKLFNFCGPLWLADRVEKSRQKHFLVWWESLLLLFAVRQCVEEITSVTHYLACTQHKVASCLFEVVQKIAGRMLSKRPV